MHNGGILAFFIEQDNGIDSEAIGPSSGLDRYGGQPASDEAMGRHGGKSEKARVKNKGGNIYIERLEAWNLPERDGT